MFIIELLVFFIIVFPLLIFIHYKPDISFWILINLYFDPGGYFTIFLGGDAFGRINISDLVIVGIIMCLLVIKPQIRTIKSNKLFRKFIIAFLIFAIYYFFVYGWLTPYIHNDLDYLTFVLKNRIFVYGFIILIAVYLFSIRSLKYFYYTTLFFCVVSLSLFFISLFTGLGLAPVTRMLRYPESEMIRIGMGGYGLFDMLFPISVIAYLLSRRIKVKLRYKEWLYFSGILMVLVLLLTLSRRTILDIPATILIIILIISYLYRSNKIKLLSKFIIPSIIVLIILSFTFQVYVSYISIITRDTFQLITTGADTRGIGDYRVSGTADLAAVKNYIQDNIWIGSGYSYVRSNEAGTAFISARGLFFASMEDAATEVPIYNLLFAYGIIGALLILRLYYFVFQLLVRFIKTLRQNILYEYINPITLIFSIYIIFVIISKLTTKIYSLGADFGNYGFSSIAIILGIGFALYEKFSTNKVIVAKYR